MVEWMLALVAVLVTVSKVNSLTVWAAIDGNEGATFTSLTMTVNVLVEVSCGLTRSKASLLVTMVVMRLVPGLWACAGVQVIMPLALTTILLGGLTRR